MSPFSPLLCARCLFDTFVSLWLFYLEQELRLCLGLTDAVKSWYLTANADCTSTNGVITLLILFTPVRS